MRLLRERYFYCYDAVCILRADASAHLLSQCTGDGESQPGGIRGCGLYGVEAVEQTPHLDLVQLLCVVGKADFSSLGQREVKVTVAVFYRIADDVGKYTGEGAAVKCALYLLIRKGDRRCDMVLF